MQGALDRKLILVVEDDRNLLAALRYNLVAEGYEVATAADGSEALNLTRERRPEPDPARPDAACYERGRSVPNTQAHR